MKLIYRNNQSDLIGKVATLLDRSPTEVMFKSFMFMLKELDINIEEEPIDTLKVQELLNEKLYKKNKQ